MKRIILTISVSCAVAVLHAAAVDWSATKVVDPWTTASSGKNTPANSWVGYLVLASSLDTITSELRNNKTDALLANSISSKTSTSKGAFNTKDATGYVTAGSQDFYLIILNAGTSNVADYFYVSSKITKDIDASLDTTIAFGSQQAGTASVGNWVPMPEPTSGLLLLLGVAGLALRRRCA